VKEAFQESLQNRMRRWVSPVLAVAGLVLLGLCVVGREAPAVQDGGQKKISAQQPAPRMRIAEITPAQKGRRVAVAGRLKSIDLPGPGSRAPYVLTLEENGAELDVVFWKDVFEQMNQTLPMPGKQLYARGRIGLYKGRLQLNVRTAEDVGELALPKIGLFSHGFR
jgi:hypothetical protein